MKFCPGGTRLTVRIGSPPRAYAGAPIMACRQQGTPWPGGLRGSMGNGCQESLPANIVLSLAYCRHLRQSMRPRKLPKKATTSIATGPSITPRSSSLAASRRVWGRSGRWFTCACGTVAPGVGTDFNGMTWASATGLALPVAVSPGQPICLCRQHHSRCPCDQPCAHASVSCWQL